MRFIGDHLEIWRPSGETFEVPLQGDRMTVGKAGTCAISIAWDETVSRTHAVLERVDDGTWLLEDLGSRNGTFVNRERLATARVLRRGDEIRIGATKLRFWGEAPLDEPTQASTGDQAPQLTARERDVLVELCRPMLLGQVFREPATAREIAAALFVTEDAVKQHLRNLFGKFGIEAAERRRRVALANEAFRRGAVGPSDL